VLRALEAGPVTGGALSASVAALRPGASSDACARVARDAARAADGELATYRSPPAAGFRAAAAAAEALANAGEAIAAVEARFDFVRGEAARAAAALIGAGQSIMYDRREELRLAPDIAPGDPLHEELAFATASLATAATRAAEALADAPAEEPEILASLGSLAEVVREIATEEVPTPDGEGADRNPFGEAADMPEDSLELAARSGSLVKKLATLNAESLLGLERAGRAERRGQWRELRRRLRRATPDDAVELIDDGKAALAAGDRGVAHRILCRARELLGGEAPHDAKAEAARGSATLCLAELDELEGELDRARARYREVAATVEGSAGDREAPHELATLEVRALLRHTRFELTTGRSSPKALKPTLRVLSKGLRGRAKMPAQRTETLVDLAGVHRGIAEVSVAMGRPADAEVELWKALEIAQGLCEQSPESTDFQREHAITALAQGMLALGRGKYGNAEDHLVVAEQLLRPLTKEGGAESARETVILCRVLTERGDIAADEGDLGGAWKAFDETAWLRLTLVELQPRRIEHWAELCRALNLLAELSLERRRPRRAKVLAERCLDLLHVLQRAAPVGPGIAGERILALELLAEIEERAGKRRVARAYGRRADAIGRDFPEVASAIRDRPPIGERAGVTAGSAFMAFDRFFEKLRIF